MLRSIKDLIGYSVVASDGKAGTVKDLLFGDRTWQMRHLVVDTRRPFNINLHYLSEDTRKHETETNVLLEPEHLGLPGMGADRRCIPVHMTQKEVRSRPSAFDLLSVEDEYDREFTRYFRHGVYDERPKVIPDTDEIVGYRPPDSAYNHSNEELRKHVQRIKEIATHHLHSAANVLAYEIRNKSETLGELDDLILDVRDWSIRYLVLGDSSPLLAKRYLIQIDKVEALDWSQAAFVVELSPEQLESLHRYAPREPVNQVDPEHAYDYRGHKPLFK